MKQSFIRSTASVDNKIMGEYRLPKVSIIIPVYNGSNFLHEAIGSALSQTYKNLEVIVVNDGSDDNGLTEEIALSYGNKILYYCKPNGWVASALNLGISKMSGVYFSWLSHDDLYKSGKIQNDVDFLMSLPETIRDSTIVFSDCSYFSGDPNKAIPRVTPAFAVEDTRFWLTISSPIHGCSLLIPRKAFDEVGFFNESLRTTQDYDLWFRLTSKFQFRRRCGCDVLGRNHGQQGGRRMSSVAFDEGNALKRSFAFQLSEAEIIRATQKELCVAYAIVASGLWRMGYSIAAWQVAMRSFGCINSSTLFAAINSIFIISFGVFRYLAVMILLRITPFRVRVFIRHKLFTYKKFFAAFIK